MKSLSNIYFEGKWYEFGKTMTLFHGTSTAFLSQIKTDGISPPDEELDDYIFDKISDYLDFYVSYLDRPFVAEEIFKKAEQSIKTLRKDTPKKKVGSVIYLSPNFPQAEVYAQGYYKYGGEIAYEAFNFVYRYMEEHYKEAEITPKFEQEKPVVLECEIPFEWAMTYGNLEKQYEGIKKYWEKHEKPYGRSFEEIITAPEFSEFEVRVAETIPPDMIKKIHVLEPKYKHT